MAKTKLDLRIPDDFLDQLRILRQGADPERILDLVEAALEYARSGVDTSERLDLSARLLFVHLRQAHDADVQAYEDRCSKNRANAMKRLAARAEAEMNEAAIAADGADGAAMAAQTVPDHTVPNHTIPDHTNERECVRSAEPSDTRKGRTRFVAPEPAEVAALFASYSLEKGIELDAESEAEAFCDFYASKGWKVGSSPMKDWRPAVKRWTRETGQRRASSPGPVLPEYSTDMSLEALY